MIRRISIKNRRADKRRRSIGKGESECNRLSGLDLLTGLKDTMERGVRPRMAIGMEIFIRVAGMSRGADETTCEELFK